MSFIFERKLNYVNNDSFFKMLKFHDAKRSCSMFMFKDELNLASIRFSEIFKLNQTYFKFYFKAERHNRALLC